MGNMIERVFAREIFDSRGNPTVEVDFFLTDGSLGRASVPSGASTGDYEALELRDGGARLKGNGVRKAVSNINDIIAKEVKGMSSHDQEKIDSLLIKLDGTKDKSRLGANSILGVSIAVCKASANSLNIPVYRYIGGLNTSIPQPFSMLSMEGTC